MTNKPRDKKTGRYIPWSGTDFEDKKKLFVTRRELMDAYIAGINDQSGIMRMPSKKALMYLKNKGFV
jgi:hypothetical protein